MQQLTGNKKQFRRYSLKTALISPLLVALFGIPLVYFPTYSRFWWYVIGALIILVPILGVIRWKTTNPHIAILHSLLTIVLFDLYSLRIWVFLGLDIRLWFIPGVLPIILAYLLPVFSPRFSGNLYALDQSKTGSILVKVLVILAPAAGGIGLAIGRLSNGNERLLLVSISASLFATLMAWLTSHSIWNLRTR